MGLAKGCIFQGGGVSMGRVYYKIASTYIFHAAPQCNDLNMYESY